MIDFCLICVDKHPPFVIKPLKLVFAETIVHEK